MIDWLKLIVKKQISIHTEKSTRLQDIVLVYDDADVVLFKKKNEVTVKK